MEGDGEIEKELDDGEIEKELDDGEVNGEKGIDNEYLQEADGEIEKELDNGEVNGEKEIDNEDVQKVDVEVEDNLHEVDEVEVYDEIKHKSDEEGEDTTTNAVAEKFSDEGLMDVSVEGDTTNESWDGYMECEVGGIPEDIAGAGCSSQQQCSNSHEDEVGGVQSGDEFSDIEWHSDDTYYYRQ